MIGKRLRKLREQAGMTQEELGEVLDPKRSKMTISRWERRGDIPERLIGPLAEALGVNREALQPRAARRPSGTDRLVDSWESYQEWRVAMLSSDLSDDERLIHAAIDTFRLPGDWSAGFTLDELTPRTGLSRERIDELWSKILYSPWLHRPFTAEWVFKLRLAA